MQQDLQLAGMAERTAESYIRAVRKLAAYTHKSPDLIDEEELRAYFYYIRNDQLWEASSIRVAYSGIKFFFQRTCPRDWPTLKYLRVEDVLKLPTVLSIDQTRSNPFGCRVTMLASGLSTPWDCACKKLCISK